MENSNGNSFIPKSPVRASTKTQGTRRVFIFTYVTFVFFFGAIIASAGIFIWGLTIDKQLTTQQDELSSQRKLFNQADLERIRELEERMNIAYNILDRQVSVYSIFQALERSTLRTVQITGFEYKKNESDTHTVSLSLSTQDFNSSQKQREAFSTESILDGATVTEISFTDKIPLEGENSSSETEVTYLVSKELSVSDIPYVPPIQSAVLVEDSPQPDLGEFVPATSEGSSVTDTTNTDVIPSSNQ